MRVSRRKSRHVSALASGAAAAAARSAGPGRLDRRVRRGERQVTSTFKNAHIRPEILSRYFDGLLPAHKTKTVAEHLDECFFCKERGRTVKALSTLSNGWAGALQKNLADRDLEDVAAVADSE